MKREERERVKERERERETDRQRQRDRDRQTGRDRRSDRHTDSQTERGQFHMAVVTKDKMHIQGKSVGHTVLHIGARGEEQGVRGMGVEGKKEVGCRERG